MNSEESLRGYCALCRAKEAELYGFERFEDGITDVEHVRACREAGCGHPALYDDLNEN
jgi:hypothetical protein